MYAVLGEHRGHDHLRVRSHARGRAHSVRRRASPAQPGGSSASATLASSDQTMRRVGGSSSPFASRSRAKRCSGEPRGSPPIARVQSSASPLRSDDLAQDEGWSSFIASGRRSPARWTVALRSFWADGVADISTMQSPPPSSSSRRRPVRRTASRRRGLAGPDLHRDDSKDALAVGADGATPELAAT